MRVGVFVAGDNQIGRRNDLGSFGVEKVPFEAFWRNVLRDVVAGRLFRVSQGGAFGPNPFSRGVVK